MEVRDCGGSWIRAYNQAEAMVSAMTFGRIRTEVLPEDVRELVILAVCAAAEGIFQAGVSPISLRRIMTAIPSPTARLIRFRQRPGRQ